MRDRPPDQRKGPPQRQLRQGPIRKHQLTKPTHKGQPRQQVAYVPGRGPKSLQAVARQLRDDGLAPVKLRTYALGIEHRLSVGGSVDLGDERLLRRLSAERRRQLLLRMYS